MSKLGIYLGAYKALHESYNIIYQDIDGTRDLPGCMMTVNLCPYDYIIATPPCNYWSRANWRKETSDYAQKTRLLLPCILMKLCMFDVPFIVENVRNDKLFKKYDLFSLPHIYVYKIGRHTYWTNRRSDFLNQINQVAKVDYKNGKKRYLSSQNLPRYLRQGGNEVHEVIESWLSYYGK